MPDVPDKQPTEQSGGYQLFMLGLCLFSLAALAVDTVVPLSPDTRQILRHADTAICAVFFLDFCHSLARARDRWHYFSRWGWIDLLSSIPLIDALRIGRAARVVRVIRVLRGVRATKQIAGFLLVRRAESAFLAAMLLSLLLVVFASIAVLQFERVPGANITSAADALWWATVTLTTVGYGDRYPITNEGRLVAVLLMVTGVGLFGAFSGFVAAWFLDPGERKQDDEVAAMRAELASLRALVEERVGREP